MGAAILTDYNQSFEAKEGVKIEQETQTVATHHLSELFPHVPETGWYDRHSRNGSGGELREIYGLDVVVIPTHEPMIR